MVTSLNDSTSCTEGVLAIDKSRTVSENDKLLLININKYLFLKIH